MHDATVKIFNSNIFFILVWNKASWVTESVSLFNSIIIHYTLLLTKRDGENKYIFFSDGTCFIIDRNVNNQNDILDLQRYP